MTAKKPWLAFKRPNVRDLAYALACPPVLLSFPALFKSQTEDITLPDTQFWQQHFQRYLPRLNALEQDPKPLNRFLGQHLTSFRLGFRFEALLLFWLQDTDFHDYRVVGHNIQIFHAEPNKHETLGELDFIIYNQKTQATEHWELTIKFFLGEAPFSPADWKGLKGADNLAKKISHMLAKPFSYDTVNVDGIVYPIDKKVAIIKGRFYEPAHEQALLQQSKPHLTWLNPQLPRGIWHQQIPSHALQKPQHWRSGRRVEWFTKRQCYDDFDFGRHPKQMADVINHFTGRRQPLQWQTGLYFYTPETDVDASQAVMLRL